MFSHENGSNERTTLLSRYLPEVKFFYPKRINNFETYERKKFYPNVRTYRIANTNAAGKLLHGCWRVIRFVSYVRDSVDGIDRERNGKNKGDNIKKRKKKEIGRKKHREREGGGKEASETRYTDWRSGSTREVYARTD